jgi:hypothetical protein
MSEREGIRGGGCAVEGGIGAARVRGHASWAKWAV